LATACTVTSAISYTLSNVTKNKNVKKQGVGKSKNGTKQGVGGGKRVRAASREEIAPQPHPNLTVAPTLPPRAQTSRLWRAARVLGYIAAFAISLIVFWPKAGLSMVNRDDPRVWLFLLRNDSFLPIWDATKQSKVELIVKPDGMTALVKLTQNDCEPETLPMLWPGDEHTFKCHVPGIESGATVVGGNVYLRVKYRYLGLFRPSAVACFKFEQTRKDAAYQWIRRGCS
jgi:hypothetical protein